jgi:hypothetical protein
MPPKKKKADYAPQHENGHKQPCQVPGCPEAGEYKAPKSPDELGEYKWFCLEHIREHNQRWDYFAGMGSEEIEDFLKDAVTGHRPTWTREQHLSQQYQKLQDALYEFLHMGAKRKAAAPQEKVLPPKLRKALATMAMEYPYDAKQLKVRYRALVKQHHPDVNKGNKASEELFKQITAAYHHLTEHIKAES